jgi:hypothetical protein
VVWVEFQMHILDMVGLEDIPLNLKTDNDSMEIFPVNKIVVITDLILTTVDLVQCIPHLCTPGVIVLIAPEINLLVADMVVDILMDMITVNNWDGGHIIPAVGIMDMDIKLLRLLLLFLHFTSNRLLPIMFCLIPFLQ